MFGFAVAALSICSSAPCNALQGFDDALLRSNCTQFANTLGQPIGNDLLQIRRPDRVGRSVAIIGKNVAFVASSEGTVRSYRNGYLSRLCGQRDKAISPMSPEKGAFYSLRTSHQLFPGHQLVLGRFFFDRTAGGKSRILAVFYQRYSEELFYDGNKIELELDGVSGAVLFCRIQTGFTTFETGETFVQAADVVKIACVKLGARASELSAVRRHFLPNSRFGSVIGEQLLSQKKVVYGWTVEGERGAVYFSPAGRILGGV